jgi:sugar phosphate isomerase/epimerase
LKRHFRIGTTSYIIPADIIPNARYLAGKVDDIQLILFESEDSSLPSAQDMQVLKEIGEREGVGYSVHFPIDTFLGETEPVRSESAAKHIEIVDLTAVLEPTVYIVHFNGDRAAPGHGTPSEDMNRWLGNSKKSMEEIISSTGVSTRKFCVETLAYPFEMVDGIVEALGLSVCIDVGHLVVNGFSTASHLQRYGNRVKSVHLHGAEGGKDHLDLTHLERPVLEAVLDFVEDREVNLTIEVFNEKDLSASLQVLKQHPGSYLGAAGCGGEGGQ